jgi:hypothetical protein
MSASYNMPWLRYFRHYLMYKYVFTKKLKLDFAIEDAANATLCTSDDLREQDQVATANLSTFSLTVMHR